MPPPETNPDALTQRTTQQVRPNHDQLQLPAPDLGDWRRLRHPQQGG